MNTAATQVLQYMTGQQQIEKIKAETEKIKTETGWISPQAQAAIALANQQTNESQSRVTQNIQNILESKQRVIESTARTSEILAQTATIEALRSPTVAKIASEIGLQAVQKALHEQQTKSEAQRTEELRAIALNAQKLYGAKASEAATIAAQAATYYTNYFLKTNQQLIDKRDIEIALLQNQNFHQIIQNTSIVTGKQIGRAHV